MLSSADFVLMNVSEKKCALLRCPVGLCVQYVRLSRCAIGCVYAAMARRAICHDLVRELRMRLRCQGVTCECVGDLARDV